MDHSTTIADYVRNLLLETGFSEEVEVAVSLLPDESGAEGAAYQILLQTPDPALLIGYHGETLSSLQIILAQHLHVQLGEWLNLSINVNDYRERRESALHALADAAVSRVLATGQAHTLSPMPANERRLVHMHLADHPQVTTSSEGAGRNRSVVVLPRQ